MTESAQTPGSYSSEIWLPMQIIQEVKNNLLPYFVKNR